MNKLIIGAFAALAMSASAWGGAMYEILVQEDYYDSGSGADMKGANYSAYVFRYEGDQNVALNYLLANRDSVQTPARSVAFSSDTQGFVEFNSYDPNVWCFTDKDSSYAAIFWSDGGDDTYVRVVGCSSYEDSNYAEFDNLSAPATDWQKVTDASAVPEPTSGLLMLIGLAGLALRRRSRGDA